MSSIDQQFIEYIVKSLVGKPDEVVIDRTIDEKGVLVTTLQVQMTLRQLTFHKWKKKLMSQKRAIASRTPAKNLLTSTT